MGGGQEAQILCKTMTSSELLSHQPLLKYEFLKQARNDKGGLELADSIMELNITLFEWANKMQL